MSPTPSMTSITSASSKTRELYQKALQTRERSYSPYSGCKVGTALITSEGLIFTGCNVENSSYGATVCAERVAIQKAVSELGKIEILEIVVVTDATPPWPPCGLCRQVISEFGKNIIVHSANLNGDTITFKWDELYPQAFTQDYLKK